MTFNVRFSDQNLNVEAESIVQALLKVMESDSYDSMCNEFYINEIKMN